MKTSATKLVADVFCFELTSYLFFLKRTSTKFFVQSDDVGTEILSESGMPFKSTSWT